MSQHPTFMSMMSAFLRTCSIQRRSTSRARTTMHRRINILHLAATALVLATYARRSACARSAWSATAVNGHRRRPEGDDAHPVDDAHPHQLRREIPGRSCRAGPLSPRKPRPERSGAAAPWLTLASGLRGGAAAAVDVPRGGAAVNAGIRRSATVSHKAPPSRWHPRTMCASGLRR